MRVFEIDHPVTQQWKRSRLAAARIPVPDGVAFVPADLPAELSVLAHATVRP